MNQTLYPTRYGIFTCTFFFNPIKYYINTVHYKGVGTMYDLLINNALLPNGDIVNVAVTGPTIFKVVPSKEQLEGKKVVDVQGLQVFPGAIDTHVHFRTPGHTHKEDWEHGVKAALRGGVTTVFDMPNNNPPIITEDLLEEKLRIIGKQPIDYRFWFGLTGTEDGKPPNILQVKFVASREEVVGCKIYMGSSTGNLLVDKEEDQRLHFQNAANLKMIIGVHAEDEQRLKERERIFAPLKICDHCLIRDFQMEIIAVQQALRLQLETGCALYFHHISCPESIHLIEKTREKGMPVFVEVTPHHANLHEAYLQGPAGAFRKMNPPLRTEKQMEELRELICTPGLIDCYGSDHAPHTVEEKWETDYKKCPSGMPGVQTGIPLMYNFVRERKMTYEHFVNLTSANAARVFKLPLKGSIEPGKDADFYFLDLEEEHTITNEEQESKCGWTPYAGMQVCVPKLTVAKGVVYDYR